METEHVHTACSAAVAWFRFLSRPSSKDYISLQPLSLSGSEHDEDMVNTYGIAPEHEHAVVSQHGGESDTSPLLGADAVARPITSDGGVAGIPGSIGNLANTIIGSGSFSLCCRSRYSCRAQECLRFLL